MCNTLLTACGNVTNIAELVLHQRLVNILIAFKFESFRVLSLKLQKKKNLNKPWTTLALVSNKLCIQRLLETESATESVTECMVNSIRNYTLCVVHRNRTAAEETWSGTKREPSKSQFKFTTIMPSKRFLICFRSPGACLLSRLQIRSTCLAETVSWKDCCCVPNWIMDRQRSPGRAALLLRRERKGESERKRRKCVWSKSIGRTAYTIESPIFLM